MNRQDKSDFCTLWIRKKSHKEIASYGTKDDTYDDIIQRILKVYRKYKDVEEKENRSDKK